MEGFILMHYNPKNEKLDSTSEGNKIWNLNTEVLQYSSISKIFIIPLPTAIKSIWTVAHELMAEAVKALSVYQTHFCFDKKTHRNCMSKILVSKDISVIKIKKVRNHFDKRLLHKVCKNLHTKNYRTWKICFFLCDIFIKSVSMPARS